MAKLLDQVNTEEELDYVLNKTESPGEEHDKLKRLDLAIELGEKKVIKTIERFIVTLSDDGELLYSLFD